MKITVENNMAKVFTPYNKTFVDQIKNIGGRRWNAEEKCWMVPETEIEQVRQYMLDVFGETDLPNECKKVTVLVTFNAEAYKYCESVCLFGKTIARAFGRDSGARVGDDVTLISGSISSGGSARNWCSCVNEGSTFKLRNVPENLLNQKTEYDISVNVIDENQIDRAALEAEKEKLLARLAEIDAMLAQ